MNEFTSLHLICKSLFFHGLLCHCNCRGISTGSPRARTVGSETSSYHALLCIAEMGTRTPALCGNLPGCLKGTAGTAAAFGSRRCWWQRSGCLGTQVLPWTCSATDACIFAALKGVNSIISIIYSAEGVPKGRTISLGSGSSCGFIKTWLFWLALQRTAVGLRHFCSLKQRYIGRLGKPNSISYFSS